MSPKRFSSLVLRIALPSLFLSASAFADDDDEIDFEDDSLYESGGLDEGEEDDKPKPTGEADESAIPGVEDPDDAGWTVPNNEDEELEFDEDEFEEDAQIKVRGVGQDTARIYRERLETMENLGADEEMLAWERYLKKYPASLFRSRIDARMSELSTDMYDEAISPSYAARAEDAGLREIRFAQPMTLESIDPRSKLRAGFEWGYPSYVNLLADVEYQIFRELSVHGGLRGRYTGWNLEMGGKYALIKSARTNLLVTAIGDFHVNLNPMHPGLRPQLGAGKRFDLGIAGTLDAMVQAGPDLLFMTNTDGTSSMSTRVVGGANLTLAPNPTVRVYAETATYMKDMFHEQIGSFRFNTVTFGIKFVNRKGANTDRFETGIGANVPYTTNYWGNHYGAVAGDFNYYL